MRYQSFYLQFTKFKFYNKCQFDILALLQITKLNKIMTKIFQIIKIIIKKIYWKHHNTITLHDFTKVQRSNNNNLR